MKRRNFIKIALLSPFVSLFASQQLSNLNIKMLGDLDDDLFVMKHKFSSFDFEALDCFQMHNPKGQIEIGGKTFKTEHIPGYIDYSKNLNLKTDEVVSIFTANERMEANPNKTLTMRTHYKSTSLYINGIELFPSLIPEKNDVPNYPTWYGDDEQPEYNYYQLWENAVVNAGLVVNLAGRYKITCLDSKNEVVTSKSIELKNKNVLNVKFDEVRDVQVISNHPFAEVDGTVFEDKKKMNDTLIRKNAIFKILIQNSNDEVTVIELPFPMPYINRIFIKSIGA